MRPGATRCPKRASVAPRDGQRQPIAASGRTRWRIAAKQISTTSNLRRLAKRPSLTNLSIAQKQIAPMTQIIRIPIKATSIAKPPCAGVVTALVEAISLTSADSLDRLDQVEPADFGRPNKNLAVAASASRWHIGIAYAILVRTRGDHIDERKRFNQIVVEIADGDRGKRSRCSPFRNHEFCSFLTVAGAQRQVKTLNRGHGCTVRFCRVERG